MWKTIAVTVSAPNPIIRVWPRAVLCVALTYNWVTQAKTASSKSIFDISLAYTSVALICGIPFFLVPLEELVPVLDGEWHDFFIDNQVRKCIMWPFSVLILVVIHSNWYSGIWPIMAM